MAVTPDRKTVLAAGARNDEIHRLDITGGNRLPAASRAHGHSQRAVLHPRGPDGGFRRLGPDGAPLGPRIRQDPLRCGFRRYPRPIAASRRKLIATAAVAGAWELPWGDLASRVPVLQEAGLAVGGPGRIQPRWRPPADHPSGRVPPALGARDGPAGPDHCPSNAAAGLSGLVPRTGIRSRRASLALRRAGSGCAGWMSALAGSSGRMTPTRGPSHFFPAAARSRGLEFGRQDQLSGFGDRQAPVDRGGEPARSLIDIAISPDGHLLASVHLDGLLCLRPGQRRIRNEWQAQGAGQVSWCVSFGPAGIWVASGGSDRTVKIWDTLTGTLLRGFEGHTEPGDVRAICGGWPDGPFVLGGPHRMPLGTCGRHWTPRPSNCADHSTAMGRLEGQARDCLPSRSGWPRPIPGAPELFGRKLVPPPKFDAIRFKKLVGELGSEDYQIREAAQRQWPTFRTCCNRRGAEGWRGVGVARGPCSARPGDETLDQALVHSRRMAAESARW